VREGQSPVPILTTLLEKIELLEAEGIHHLVVVPFNNVFSNQSAEEYVQHFLFEKMNPHTVIIGYDHRFGKGRQGDYHLLENYGRKLGFRVKEISEKVLNEVTISSTRIREALLQGDIETANKFLGHAYFFEGLVVKGSQLGRQINYPTANILVADTEKLIPAKGVYAVAVEIRGKKYKTRFKGMMNIGVRPTVGGTKQVIEVNIFDFDDDIYGLTLRVFVKHFLRDEVDLGSIEALKEQLGKDKQEALFKLMNIA
jgi:riboflavin kinase/FMN adenylyltransferase